VLIAKIRPNIEKLIVIGACLMGFSLRIFFIALGRSLWIDEAMLAVNIVNRSFLGLFQPLSLNQAAPIGFCLLQKAITSLLGGRDYLFRIIPLLAGLVSIPLMYFVSRKYVGQLAAFFALGLFALSSKLTYFSVDAKQYSTDVLATLLLLLIVLKCLEGQATLRWFVVLGPTGSIIIWFSQPSCFILAAILMTLGLTFALRRDKLHLYWIIGIGAAWGISLGLNYLISLQYMASNSFLFDYWKGNFAPLAPWSNFIWYKDTFISMLKNPDNLPVSAITIGLLVIGMISLAYRRWQFLLLLVMPFFLTLIASALKKYPFNGRLLLFLLPLLLLLLAEGVGRIVTLLKRINQPLAWLAYATLIIYFIHGPITIAHKNIKSPPMGENIKPVISYISENYHRTDLIYVYYSAYPAFEFYAPFYGFNENNYIAGIMSKDIPRKYLADIDKLKGNERVWFVFTHNFVGKVNEQNYFLQHLNKIGLKTSEYKSAGASVYLYDLEQIYSQTHPIN
jgi:Dolichyl-phosphate-mannose-protein mannosyltransferase